MKVVFDTNFILDLVNVIVVDGEKCSDALASEMDDFEDALVAVCAESVNADFIVTRDKGFLDTSYCNVQLVSPDGLRGILDGGQGSADCV